MMLYRKVPSEYNGEKVYPNNNGETVYSYAAIDGYPLLDIRTVSNMGRYDLDYLNTGDRIRISDGDNYMIVEVSPFKTSSKLYAYIVKNVGMTVGAAVQDGTISIEFPANHTNISTAVVNPRTLSKFSMASDDNIIHEGSIVNSITAPTAIFESIKSFDEDFSILLKPRRGDGASNFYIGAYDLTNNDKTNKYKCEYSSSEVNPNRKNSSSIYKLEYIKDTRSLKFYKDDSVQSSTTLSGSDDVKIFGQIDYGQMEIYNYFEDYDPSLIAMYGAIYKPSSVLKYWTGDSKYYAVGDVVLGQYNGIFKAFKKIKDASYLFNVSLVPVQVGDITNVVGNYSITSITATIDGVKVQTSGYDTNGNVATSSYVRNYAVVENGIIGNIVGNNASDELYLLIDGQWYYYTSLDHDSEVNKSLVSIQDYHDEDYWEMVDNDDYFNYYSPLNPYRCTDGSVGTETIFQANDYIDIYPTEQFDFIALQKVYGTTATIEVRESNNTVSYSTTVNFQDEYVLMADDRETRDVILPTYYDNTYHIRVIFNSAGKIGNIFVGIGDEYPCVEEGASQSPKNFRTLETNKISGLRYMNTDETVLVKTALSLTIEDASTVPSLVRKLNRSLKETVFAKATEIDKFRHLNHSGFLTMPTIKTYQNYSQISFSIEEYENV